MIQELTKSTDVEALEESYVKRFSHMPKVTLQFFCKNGWKVSSKKMLHRATWIPITDSSMSWGRGFMQVIIW